ncbi:Myristoylated alanine-rich C-kinase [Melia azedarach]|uniref:Myristoylated alanine-rich C-kinase n=1 Tax=Melia azedarach TaxID=155640 RepID=A0ACC1XVW9_MELAZ|nr:Myristoylated alanine-rich C-kinase [Melia azedarach]
MLDVGESQHSRVDSGAVAPGNVASSPISSSRTKRYKVCVGRGRSRAAGESSEKDADQSFFLDDEGTSVTTEMLAQLRKAYDISSSVELSLPRPGFRPSRPGSNEVVIHRQSFEYDFRLLIQPFFAQILSGLGVAPTQLSSMAWRNLARLYILWKEVLGVEPTIEDVHATFTLTTAPKKLGLYYLKTYTGQPHLVPQVNPNTADKAWDDFWFVVSSDWGQTVVEDGETYVVPNQFKALGDEVPTPSSITRRMVEGSKTNLAFLQLVRDRMAKAAGASRQRAATGSEGSGKSVATFSGLPPRPKHAKKVEGPGWTSQLAVDLGGVLGSHFSHASRALPVLKQVLEFSDSEKGREGSFLMSQFDDKLKEGSTSADCIAKLEAQLSRLTQKVKDKDDQISKLEDQLGEARDKVGSVKTQLRAQVERTNELQASVDKLEAEASSNLLHIYHYAQYQVTREFPDLDLDYMDFGFN